MHLVFRSTDCIHFLAVAGLVLATSTLTVAGDRPNIIVILADDLGSGDVSAYNTNPNTSNVTTTNINRLVQEGIRFNNAHTPSAVCSPTRFGLLTERHPFRDGLADRVQSQYGDVWLPEGERTVANILGDAGYTTGFSGKWYLRYDVFDNNGN